MQHLLFRARLGGHGLDRIEFLAGNQIHARENPFELIAQPSLDLAAHARGHAKRPGCHPGKIIEQAPRDKDAVVVADLNLDMIEEVRAVWQFYRDRRPDAYGDLVSP